MIGGWAREFVVACGAGAAGCLLTTLVALRTTPESLERINVNGRRVPAVLGFGIVTGVVSGLFALTLLGSAILLWVSALGYSASVLAVAGIMFSAGLLDDRKGDEAARGFRGHLGAARRGAITGGLVKIAAGGLAGLGAALSAPGVLMKIEMFLLVPLTANLFNLLDRAPGRAAKAGWLLVVPLVLFGDPGWALAAAGLIGALVVVTPFDLRERGMLGDAGANPLGAIIGFGAILALPEPFRAAAVLVVAGLNLASETRSFSHVIESTPWLRRLDRIGRK